MQQELLGWRPRGGCREGAGRKRTSLRMPHRSRADFRNGVCHVTLRLRRGLPSLRSKRVVREVESTFRRGCERGDFRLADYSRQRDHVHLIVEALDAAALGCGLRALSVRLVRAANRIWCRRGAVVGDRYHFRVLRTPLEVRNALRYVLLNARKHSEGGVRRAHPDPASSGPWFEGWAQRVPQPRALTPVARAQTWLLTRGWRRHRAISLLEAPKGF